MMMSKDSKKWEKDDLDKLIQIIGNMLVQGHQFKKIAHDWPLTKIFSIQQPDDFGLGMLVGSIFNEFNNYWNEKYDSHMSLENVQFMKSQINQVTDMLRDGLNK